MATPWWRWPDYAGRAAWLSWSCPSIALRRAQRQGAPTTIRRCRHQDVPEATLFQMWVLARFRVDGSPVMLEACTPRAGRKPFKS
jgi:hypothetical protein